MASGSYDGVFIVGCGQTEYTRRTDKAIQRLIWEAIDLALRSANLTWKAVDGLGATCFVLPPDNVTVLAEHFGVAPRWLFQGVYGGASSIIAMLHAARAIQAGDADVVACVAADIFDVAMHNQLLDRFNTSMRDYFAPFGFGGANGVFALHTRLYMERFGATREDFGRLCVAQRTNALLNPNALMKKPLTMEEYLSAREIADPLRLFDCVHPCCGADAVILANEKVAGDLGVPLVSILGGGEQHNYPAEDIYSLRGGWEAMSERMYAQGGCSPSDLQFAQLYDDYPVMEFIQLEGLGVSTEGPNGGVPPRYRCDGSWRFPNQHGRRPALGRASRRERRDDRRVRGCHPAPAGRPEPGRCHVTAASWRATGWWPMAAASPPAPQFSAGQVRRPSECRNGLFRTSIR